MRATITMPLETLKSIIERAREYEVVDEEDFDEEDDEAEDDDEDSDADLDDDDTDAPLLVANDDELDDEEDNDLGDEEEVFEDVLEGLSSEELAELLALSWVGEGDYENWEEAIGAARTLSQNDLIVQLAENPTLSDAIEGGLVALGYEISND